MVWKIVQTVEDGSKFITAIPSSWEQSGNLFWPPPEWGSIDKLRGNLKISPDNSWTVYKCKVKVQMIESFSEAKKLEKILSTVETENEEDIVSNFKRKRREPVRERQIQITKWDFNSMLAETYCPTANSNPTQEIPSPENIEPANSSAGNYSEGNDIFLNSPPSNPPPTISGLASSPVISSPVISSPAPAISSAVNLSAGNFLSLDSSQLISPTASFSRLTSVTSSSVNTLPVTSSTNPAPCTQLLTHPSTSINCSCSVQYTEELKNFKIDVTKSFTELSVKVDKLLQISIMKPRTDIPTKQNYEKFPLCSVEEVEQFEYKLKTQNFRNDVFHQLTVIGGTTGRENGFKIAAKLVDYMFTRAVQQQYTWTGCSKGPTKKLPFMKNSNIIDLFHTVVNAADQNFTLHDNEIFFKIKILKHGNARNATKAK